MFCSCSWQLERLQTGRLADLSSSKSDSPNLLDLTITIPSKSKQISDLYFIVLRSSSRWLSVQAAVISRAHRTRSLSSAASSVASARSAATNSIPAQHVQPLGRPVSLYIGSDGLEVDMSSLSARRTRIFTNVWQGLKSWWRTKFLRSRLHSRHPPQRHAHKLPPPHPYRGPIEQHLLVILPMTFGWT